MTRIEDALYRDHTAHWVSGFEIAGDTIVITLHPSARADLRTFAKFADSIVLSFDDSYADEAGKAFPWDVIGFDSELVSPDRWRYCLHTDAGEYMFEAGWPVVEFV